MEATIPYSFELALAKPILDKWTDTYDLHHSHIQHDPQKESNEYPFVGLSLNEQLWDKLPDNDDGDLEAMVSQRARWDFDNQYSSEDFKKEMGFKLCFDINSYRLIALTPVKHLWYKREHAESYIRDMYEDTSFFDRDELNALEDEIKDIDEDLCKCALFLDWFDKSVPGFQNWFDDHVVVFSGDIEDGEFDFVNYDWFDAMKEDEDWKLWKEHKEVEDEIKKENKIQQRKAISRELDILVPDISEDMKNIVNNTVVET